MIHTQDNKNTQSYKIVAVEQTRTSTDVILEGISRDAGAKRTTLDTTVRTCYSVESICIKYNGIFVQKILMYFF